MQALANNATPSVTQRITKSDDNNDHEMKIHLSKAKCEPLTKKLKLVYELLKADCNDVTLHSNLLQTQQ